LHLAAVHPQLAGIAAQSRHRVEPSGGARLVHRKHVHEIEMPRVVTAEIAVEPEFTVVVAPIPVFGGGDAVDQGAIIQHGQVKAAAVPRHELRRVLVDQIEKAANELGLGVIRRADRSDPEAGGIAQRARDRDHALILEREKIGSRLRPSFLHDPVEHGAIGQFGAHAERAPQTRDVGHRLDVERQNGRHDPPGNTPVER